MMVVPISFEFSDAAPVTPSALPDDSGLAPLVLPEAFLARSGLEQAADARHQQLPAEGSVRRFRSAMEEETSLPDHRYLAFGIWQPSQPATDPAEITGPATREEGSVPVIETPTIDIRQPTADVRQPTVDDRQTTADVRQPTVGDQQPIIDVRQPTAEDALRDSVSPREMAAMPQPTGSVPGEEGSVPVIENPAIDTRQPAIDTQQPTIDMRQPTVEDRQPTIDERQPTIDMRQPAVGDGQPTADMRQPAVEDTLRGSASLREVTAMPQPMGSVPTTSDQQPIVVEMTVSGEKHVGFKDENAQPVVNRPVIDKPVAEVAIHNTGIVDKSIVDKPIIDKPIVDKAVIDRPVVEVLTTERTTIKKTVPEKSVVENLLPPERLVVGEERVATVKVVTTGVTVEAPHRDKIVEVVVPVVPHETGSVPVIENPTADVRQPTVGDQQPTADMRQPAVGDRQPTIDTRQPTIGDQQPTADMRQPTVDARQPTIDVRQPTVGDQQPTIDMRQPVVDGQQPTIDMRQPTVEGILRASASPRDTAPIAQPTGSVPEVEEEQKVVQAADVRMPTAVDVQMPVGTAQAVDPAASARTVDIVETVEKIVAAVSEQIEVVPSLVKGEETVIIHLKPDVLGGSDISMSAKDGVLTLEISPATPETAALAEKHVPQLERALAEHVTTFHGFAVVVKKGKSDETK